MARVEDGPARQRRSLTGRKLVGVYLPNDLKIDLKILAVRRETSMSALVEEALLAQMVLELPELLVLAGNKGIDLRSAVVNVEARFGRKLLPDEPSIPQQPRVSVSSALHSAWRAFRRWI